MGKRALLPVVAAAVAALLAPPAQSAAADEPGAVAVQGCHLALVELHDDLERLAGFVPAPFRVATFYGPGTGALSLWSFRCEQMAVPGGQAGPGQLSLVVVQIERPDGDPPAVSYLHNFDFYLLQAYTDRRDLVRHARGLPLAHAAHMSFERSADPLPSSHVTVADGRSGYEVRVSPSLQHPLHDHDNSFWHSGRAGIVELQLTLFNALDKWCPYRTSACSSVVTRPGSDLAHVLGAESRHDGLGIDHDPVPQGALRVRRDALATG